MMIKYMVMTMSTNIDVTVKNCYPQLTEKKSLCFADGMVGALPVFETREQAEAFDEQNSGIVELEL